MKLISVLFLFLLLLASSAWAQSETQPESKPQASSSTYSKGDKVEALWQGAWYKGTIMNRDKENYYEVHFDGYWHSRNEVLPTDRIRMPASRAIPDPADLKTGDAVEIYQGDHYKPAVFVEAKNKSAVVRFADGNKTKEERVPLHKVSKVQ